MDDKTTRLVNQLKSNPAMLRSLSPGTGRP